MKYCIQTSLATVVLWLVAAPATAQFLSSFSTSRIALSERRLMTELQSEPLRRMFLAKVGAEVPPWKLTLEVEGDNVGGWDVRLAFDVEGLDADVRKRLFDQLVKYVQLRLQGYSQLTALQEAAEMRVSDKWLEAALAKSFRTVTTDRMFPWVSRTGRIAHVMLDGEYGWLFTATRDQNGRFELEATRLDQKEFDFQYYGAIQNARIAAVKELGEVRAKDRADVWNKMKLILAAEGIQWKAPSELNDVIPQLDL